MWIAFFQDSWQVLTSWTSRIPRNPPVYRVLERTPMLVAQREIACLKSENKDTRFGGETRKKSQFSRTDRAAVKSSGSFWPVSQKSSPSKDPGEEDRAPSGFVSHLVYRLRPLLLLLQAVSELL
ncbi:hypothetical protein NDN08_000295 [Rhodosorus marinus]|uniref:Uncharacterized protein n=1 Tax=Rhodosorus marinus TaxID=101924 RepID=A0AAV8UT35_9RHOD|nr:hypothetical protein NDN08_000295 [Rhodosorus marinus]